MAVTQVGIWNLALRSIGAKKITSINESTESARILSDIWDYILDEVLTAHPWNFAIKRTALTALGGTITTWTVSGTTNVWQAALTTEPASVSFDGVTGTKKTSIAACTAAGYWYWASNILYAYSTSDPDTAYDTIKATIPEFDYDYAYGLPSDCLRVICMSVIEPFKIEGEMLLTDESSCKIKYIAQITDVTKFSSLFISALAARLAAEAAFPISNSSTLFDIKFKEYLVKLKYAKSIDSQEGSFEPEEESSWIDDRI